MIDPLIARAVAVGFGLLWIAAAWHKFAIRQSFGGVLDDYHLFPVAAVRSMTLLVPVIELCLGAAWLLGIAPLVVATTTALLLVSYAAAIAINLFRGRAFISCGCGLSPQADAQPLSWILVSRNLLLVLCAFLTLVPQTHRTLRISDYVVLVLALLVIALLHSAVSQLLRNRAAMGAWSPVNE